MCQEDRLDFQARGVSIHTSLEGCSREDIIHHLNYAGVIPECYDHDSTEEKLFAKYCDALLARAWCELGLNASPIIERADSADVIGHGEDYSIVGDAKAFRLSRTAKNQKDFKVEALNQWRKGADYACLVGPLYQFPSNKSQIYVQAIRYNVTILSFTHLSFMLKAGFKDSKALKELWEATKGLAVSKAANQYWATINKIILKITGASYKKWERELQEAAERLPAQGIEQITYWEGILAKIRELPKEALVEKLITALKIDAKIDVIKRAAGIIPSSDVDDEEDT